jgi:large subunit ribosomal protein L22
MTATKTNERPGTRAMHRYCGLSASKARQVLDLIRGEDVQRAAEILTGTEREAAEVIGKVLTSAVSNAAHNDSQNPEELYVAACYADEGATMKRWRPRARGRATRIRKRSCHITIIVSRLPADRLELRRKRMEAVSANRSRRVDASRRRADLSGRISRRRAAQAAAEAEKAAAEGAEAEEAEADESVTDETVSEETAIEETAAGEPTASDDVEAEEDEEEAPAPAKKAAKGTKAAPATKATKATKAAPATKAAKAAKAAPAKKTTKATKATAKANASAGDTTEDASDDATDDAAEDEKGK